MVASVAVDLSCISFAKSVMFLAMPNDLDDVLPYENEEKTAEDDDEIDAENAEVKITRTPRRPKNYRASSRARTIAPKELHRIRKKNAALPIDEDSVYPDDVARPVIRLDCLSGGLNAQRPCPFVSCQHHLYLDANRETGALKMNFPHLEVWEMTETCVLDVADRGGITLEEVGVIMNLTRERIRQVEVRALSNSGFQYELDHGCSRCGGDMEILDDSTGVPGRIASCTMCEREIKEPA